MESLLKEMQTLSRKGMLLVPTNLFICFLVPYHVYALNLQKCKRLPSYANILWINKESNIKINKFVTEAILIRNAHYLCIAQPQTHENTFMVYFLLQNIGKVY